MPSHRCHYESSDESSDESSNECECKRCDKKKHKQSCCEKERHKKCIKGCRKHNRCYKKSKCSISRNQPNVIDYFKNDCQDGKVILITIS